MIHTLLYFTSLMTIADHSLMTITGSPGRLLKKWSAHAKVDPFYAWAEPCNFSNDAQLGWSYDAATRSVTKNVGGSLGLGCLAGTGAGQSLTVVACNEPETPHAWVLDNKRLWQGASPPKPTVTDELSSTGEGALVVKPCDSDKPGRRWSFSAPPGNSLVRRVLVRVCVGVSVGVSVSVSVCVRVRVRVRARVRVRVHVPGLLLECVRVHARGARTACMVCTAWVRACLVLTLVHDLANLPRN